MAIASCALVDNHVVFVVVCQMYHPLRMAAYKTVSLLIEMPFPEIYRTMCNYIQLYV
jgi:hypothetical protein